MPNPETTIATTPESSLAIHRSEVLKLNGASEYVTPTATELEVEEGIDNLIADVSKELDASAMANSFFPHYFAWSDGETASFLEDEKHKPFKSKIEFENEQKDLQTIGKYLVAKYTEEKAKPGVDAQKKAEEIGQNLTMFYAYSLTKLYLESDNDFNDDLVDVDKPSRRTELPVAGDEIKNVFKSEIERVSSGTDTNTEQQLQDILDLTSGGYIRTIPGLLKNHNLDSTTRTILENVHLGRMKSETFIRRKLQILYQTEKYREAIGIDLDMLYEINGLKSGEQLLRVLTTYLQNDEKRQGLKDLIEEGIGGSLPDQKISYLDILQKRTTAQKLPSQIETDQERQNKIAASKKYFTDTLPFFVVDDPLTHLQTTTAFGANTRGVNGTYPNINGEILKIIGLDPRMPKNRFISIEGHERTHQLHAVILEKLDNQENKNIKTYETLDVSIHETFTDLVQSQIEQLLEVTDKENGEENKDSSKLFEALEVNEAILTTYMQYTTRLLVTERIRPDKDKLSDTEVKEIYEEIKNGLDNLEQLGLVTFPDATITKLDPLFIFDGLAYLPSDIPDVLLNNKTDSHTPENSVVDNVSDNSELQAEIRVPEEDLKSTFVERFGEIWITKPEAQILLCALMAKSQVQKDLSTYPDFIRNADIEYENEKLKSIDLSIKIPKPALAQ